jgi:hypothetical protein
MQGKGEIMANIFLAIPQYRKIPDAEIERIRKELQMDWWKPYLKKGFHPMFDESVRRLVSAGRHRIRHCVITGDGNLPRVRSNHLGTWREEYNTQDRCEYFMVVDDDISWPPEAIDFLIEDDKPIVSGVYTFKTENENYVGKVCARFIEGQDVEEDRPFKIRWFNGGFVIIKAEALLTMINHYPDLEIRMPSELNMGAERTWALWCPRVHEGELLSEDWAFSQRAREIGFDIWADMRFKLIHWNAEYGFTISLRGEENVIEGWMTEAELDWLYWQSQKMDSIAEIGSWKGRSTYALLSGCRGDVYAIDHFQGDPNSEQQKVAKHEDIYEVFMKNVGYFPNLKVMRMSSLEAAGGMDGNRIDMVFIDGNHEAAKEDIEAWLPKTKGLICGHDYNRECVRKAVSETIGEVKTFQSIWFKELR